MACKTDMVERFHTVSPEGIYSYVGFGGSAQCTAPCHTLTALMTHPLPADYRDRQHMAQLLHSGELGRAFFEKGGSLFAVLQSIVGLEPLSVVDALALWIKPTADPGSAHSAKPPAPLVSLRDLSMHDIMLGIGDEIALAGLL